VAGAAPPWRRQGPSPGVVVAKPAGAHPKAIQERLGHASITMTLDRYGHLLPGLGDSLADALDSAYESAGAARENVVELRR
jgi:hypothetical protein